MKTKDHYGHEVEIPDLVSIAGFEGFTKREFFATMALQGILANHSEAVHVDSMNEQCCYARMYADQLIRELGE